jgi:hypothetical protein
MFEDIQMHKHLAHYNQTECIQIFKYSYI